MSFIPNILTASSINTTIRQIKAWSTWLKKKFPERDDLENPNRDTPYFICLYILTQCDIPEPKSEDFWIREAKDQSLSHSHKIRAAVSYHYGFIRGRPQLWLEQNDGTFSGNPSLSPEVARYMRALRRKKVSSKRSNNTSFMLNNNRLEPDKLQRVLAQLPNSNFLNSGNTTNAGKS